MRRVDFGPLSGVSSNRPIYAFGATSPLPRVPATVSSQSDFQTFTLGQSLRREYRRISKKIIGRIPPEFRKKYRPGAWRTSVCAGATAAEMGTQFSEGYPGGLCPALVA